MNLKNKLSCFIKTEKALLKLLNNTKFQNQPYIRWIENFNNFGSFKVQDNRTVEENTQLKFKKLSGKIQIDETFIKEIHKGNFKHKTDPRRIHLDPFATNTKCCIQMAVDNNNNIYVKSTNTKRLQKQWVIENMNKELINQNSIITSDMQKLYFLVAKQTNSTLCVTKTTINPEDSYRNLNKISKLKSSLKEALIHYHGLGFTNIQNYLNLWKWKYQHKGLTPNQQTVVLYFNV